MVGQTEIAQCSGGPCLTFDLLGQLGFPRRKLLLMLISVLSPVPSPFLEHSVSAMVQGTLERLGRFGQDLVAITVAV